VVGGPVINPTSTLSEKTIPSVHNLFNKARVNLVLFVHSLGSETLASLPSLRIFQKQGQRMEIQRKSYPQDTIASLTTMMTGHSPSIHGIVNSQWEARDGRRSAYSSNAGPRVFNVNDQLSQAFEGQPLIISGSLDFQMASTLAVNPKNRLGGNNYALFWNEEQSRFESIYEDRVQGLNISAEDLASIFASDERMRSTFDLANKEEYKFLAEIAFLKNMVQQLQDNEIYATFAKDHVPDLLSFSFASLKALKNSGSPKFTAAVQMLDDTILEVFGKLSAIYEGKVSLEVFFLGTPAYEKIAQDTQLKNQLFSLLKDNVNKQIFDQYFPSIYLTSPTGSQEICQRVREEIENEVICTNHFAEIPTLKEYRFVLQDATDDATVFLTVLWMSIIMFLFALAAIWAMCQMELPADSILYRTGAPKQHTS